MRINSNNTTGVSSASQSLFGNRIRQKEISSSPAYTSAYKVEISNRAMDMMRQYGEEDLATFNSDVLNYTRNLKLEFKY